MSRPRRTETESAEDNFRREIRIRQGYYDLMSQRELAASSGIPQSTLSKRIANPEDLTVAELRKLIGTLEPDPVAVLSLIGYSPAALRRLKAAGE